MYTSLTRQPVRLNIKEINKMCRFKSGIILKSRSYIAEGYDDSHTNLLEKLNIEDTTENAMRKFVRVELIPDNDEWWTDPKDWKVNIDQDILPDWFKEDEQKYLEEFRKRVIGWWNDHVFVDKTIERLECGYYRLKRCEVKKLLNNVKVMLDNSTVQRMLDNSTVQEMWDNSTVQEMWDNSIIVRDLDNNVIVAETNNAKLKKHVNK